MISIIVPTIRGRERWLEACLASYARTCPGAEVIVVHDRPTCGIAWNDGFGRSSGDWIHFTADDIEAHHGWWQAAQACSSDDTIPAPRLLNPDGSLQACGDLGYHKDDGKACSFTRVPFLTRAQAELVYPVIETHYSTDVWVSEICRLHGIQTRMCNGYLLTHHYAPEGRVDERLVDDEQRAREAYIAYRERSGLPLPRKLWAECNA